MLTQKARYGLRAMVKLAETGDELMFIGDLSESERIPRKFLEAILIELRNKGLLDSRRGKAGGYRLAREPGQITLGEIIRILDGPLAPIRCASRTAFIPCDDCGDVDACWIRWVMQDVRDAMSNILDKRTLADALRYRTASGQVPYSFDI